MALKVVPPDLDATTHWGRSMHTVGRILSSVELLNAAARHAARDSKARMEELYQISDRLLEIAEGVRAELEAANHA